jgi:aspartate dehydrogenase
MHLGIIGLGAIGRGLVGVLARELAAPLERVTALVRPAQAEAAAALLGDPRLALAADAVTGADGLLAARPDLVVECAGHGAAGEVVPRTLAAGIETVLASVGALADAAVEARLVAAAREGRTRLVLPAGAIGGIDLLRALATAGLEAVTYVGTKPPAAWAGTPAEAVCDLGAVAAPVVIFEGDARAAARSFPKNANVAATVALAGLGFERTRVRLVADPGAGGNVHALEVRSAAARFEIRIEGVPSPDNPRTSLATVHSLAREVLNRVRPVAV